ncbi:MAG TPA: helix-turn-helix domain-containing protein [Polyangia bacterium]|nr:helix-turn-helix domain-containing protein [Polyangia bacterium]
MKSYGQFCSVARALELLGERWTLLVVRELLMGGRSFGDIRRGIPRISRTMLSARLRELSDGGVITRDGGGYALTDAGRELHGVVAALGSWGQRWLGRHVGEDELDLDALAWDMHRRVNRARLPPRPVVVRIEAADLRRSRPRWLLLRASEVSLCASNPGFPESLTLRGDRRTLVAWWRGDVDFATARRRGLAVDGPPSLARAFPTWFERYLFADVPPAA